MNRGLKKQKVMPLYVGRFVWLLKPAGPEHGEHYSCTGRKPKFAETKK